METLDLGPITVALTQIPVNSQASATPAKAPRFHSYTDEAEPAVQGLPRPTQLPAGLSFLDATLITSPVQTAIWTYHDPATGRSLTLVCTGLDSLETPDGSKPVVYVPGESLDEVRVRTNQAARVGVSADPSWRGAKTTYVWLRDGAVFQISGRGITEEELSVAAESM